jgi:hypothetical protein
MGRIMTSQIVCASGLPEAKEVLAVLQKAMWSQAALK